MLIFTPNKAIMIRGSGTMILILFFTISRFKSFITTDSHTAKNKVVPVNHSKSFVMVI
jgi:hypothetical protein